VSDLVASALEKNMLLYNSAASPSPSAGHCQPADAECNGNTSSPPTTPLDNATATRITDAAASNSTTGTPPRKRATLRKATSTSKTPHRTSATDSISPIATDHWLGSPTPHETSVPVAEHHDQQQPEQQPEQQPQSTTKLVHESWHEFWQRALLELSSNTTMTKRHLNAYLESINQSLLHVDQACVIQSIVQHISALAVQQQSTTMQLLEQATNNDNDNDNDNDNHASTACILALKRMISSDLLGVFCLVASLPSATNQV
jgi:hypothetical protein